MLELIRALVMQFKLNLDEIKYVKILYKDSNNEPCSTKAAIKKISEREIITCTKYKDESKTQVPQEMTLSIVCNDGLYRTKTKLVAIENAEPYNIFVLATPSGMEYQQNREYFRVPIESDCVYRVHNDFDDYEFEGKTINLSANGVCVLFDEPLLSPKESQLSLIIGGKHVDVKARYVRSELVDNKYRASFTFTKISEQDRDFISQVCIKKQLEQRRKSIY